MAAFSEMHTMQPAGGMDTTELRWRADATGLGVSGTIRWRGVSYPIDAAWPWPLHPRRIQWQVLLAPDGTVLLAHDGDGWPDVYTRYTMIAHGWIFPDGDEEPWEHCVFINVMHAGATWDHPDVGGHFTQPDGTHQREHPQRGLTTLRTPQPVVGGGFWPRPD